MPSGPTTGKSSFFTACDAGKWRVPSPAMGMTALQTIDFEFITKRAESVLVRVMCSAYLYEFINRLDTYAKLSGIGDIRKNAIAELIKCGVAIGVKIIF
jgi:hypothetical protein